MRYARRTKVPIETSRAEIERVLMKYGADQFLYGRDEGKVMIGFRMSGLAVQMQVPLPEEEQGKRQAFRVLLMVIKAKLELIEMEYSTVAREFMADLLLPDGRTVHSWLLPLIEGGQMPKALPMPGGGQ